MIPCQSRCPWPLLPVSRKINRQQWSSGPCSYGSVPLWSPRRKPPNSPSIFLMCFRPSCSAVSREYKWLWCICKPTTPVLYDLVSKSTTPVQSWGRLRIARRTTAAGGRTCVMIEQSSAMDAVDRSRWTPWTMVNRCWSAAWVPTTPHGGRRGWSLLESWHRWWGRWSVTTPPPVRIPQRIEGAHRFTHGLS
jgi:hypothetical protein